MGRTTPGGKNIFEAAATYGLPAVKYFVENKNVSVTSVNADNRTAAHLAARTGKLESVKFLIGKDSSLLETADAHGYTVLHLAVVEGALNVVTYLVDSCNVDIYQPNNMYFGNTAVHFAAQAGQMKVLKFFLEKKKADINVLNDRGEPPAFLAAANKQITVMRYIIEKWNGTDLTIVDRNKRNILFSSVRSGDVRIPKLILTKHKVELDVNQRDIDGATICLIGSKLGYFDFVKYIVSWKHADINIADKNGRTPLHEASSEGHIYLVKFLIEHGASRKARDNVGNKPIDYAANDEVLSSFRRSAVKRKYRSVSYPREFFLSPEQRFPKLNEMRIPVSGRVTVVAQIQRNPTSNESFVDSFLNLARVFMAYAHHYRSLVPLKLATLGKIDPIAIESVYSKLYFEHLK